MPVHHLPPGPETVVCPPRPLGQPGHRALVRVRMQIGNAGQQATGDNPGDSVVYDYRCDIAVAGYFDANIIRPTIWQQRAFKMQGFNWPANPSKTVDTVKYYTCIYKYVLISRLNPC